MYLRIPKPIKAELVMTLLNQWDSAHGADKDFRFYQVEAEEIAQQIRKNSKPESVEKVVSKAIRFRMELEGLDEPLDRKSVV